jgi:hypothetical protein
MTEYIMLLLLSASWAALIYMNIVTVQRMMTFD